MLTLTSGLAHNKRTPTDINVMQANMYKPPGALSWAAGVDGTYSSNNLGNVSTDLAFGAWTNAPSENLGFWFSGLQAANGGFVDYLPYQNKSDQANTDSETFFQVDMSSPGAAKWQNLTWPSWLAPRSEGGLVWLPYGNNGILLAFGGIDLPGDQGGSGLLLNQSMRGAKNSYMTNIGVYDIGQKTWGLQSTLEKTQPPQMAQFCTVTASSADNTSHFIYVYGGYDGTYQATTAYDSIWVLSVPAFQWTKLSDGNSNHARARQLCVMPNPTQMLSIGGTTEAGALNNPDWLDVYDLNAQSWTHYYNSSSNATYQVPSAIINQLGQGNATGGFSVPSTGLNSSVSSMLTTYHKTITGYSPYNYCAPKGATNTTVPVPPATSSAVAKKTPAWQTPVIAVLAVIAGLAILGGLFFFCCCRGRRNKNDESNKRRSIVSWMHKSDPKLTSNPDSESTAVNNKDYFNVKPIAGTYEMASNVNSPGGHVYSHGNPQIVNSPSFGGEMSSTPARHEIMTHPTRDSMSIGQHPYYPHSIEGDFINRSVRSDSISSPSSEGAVPSTLNATLNSRGVLNPIELALNSSTDNTPHAHHATTLSVSSDGAHPQSTSAEPIYPAINRKPLSSEGLPALSQGDTDYKQGHHRQQSSLSSDLATLPSPTAAEDQRRSMMIDGLPAIMQSPVQSPVGTGPTKKPSGHLKSAYQEQFD